MENNINLEYLTKESSDNVLDTIYSIEILQDMIEESATQYFLLRIALNKLNEAFKNIENCRKLISIPD